jgi:hypothetical protein
MKVSVSFKLGGLILPIALASAAQASDIDQPGQVEPGNQFRIDRYHSPRVPDSDPVNSFRPFTAPARSGEFGSSSSPPRPAPNRNHPVGNATDSFRPYTEPTTTNDTASAGEQPPPGSTLGTDGHKDKLFNPQLSAHSNTQYRSTSGYVLGKTGKYALRYGPRILQFIRY